MLRVGTIAIAAIGLVFGAAAGYAQVQGLSLGRSAQAPMHENRAPASKTELADRFAKIKTEYAEIRAAAAKYAPLKDDAPAELRVVRLKVGDAMRAYDLYEERAQRQRDELNLLVDLTDVQSLRLRIAMDRLATMKTMIVNLMKTMNGTGDTLTARTEAAMPAQRSIQKH